MGWVWQRMKTLEETVLATEIGSGSTAKQVGREPREFGNFNMYQGLVNHSGVAYEGERHLGVP